MHPELDWLDTQLPAMTATLTDWANVNSGTLHLAGLERQCGLLEQAFSALGDERERLACDPYESIDALGEMVPVPLGPCLRVRCRRLAPLRVLLAIHMDTVYAADSPFQHVELIDANTLRGPGVSDAKGGLVVLLFAVRALERFVERTGCDRLGWDMLINSDEEIGSPGSTRLFEELAAEVDLGLLFEPALADGDLASGRKGSGNFAIRVGGRSAHAGRDFHHGRNAIVAAAKLAIELHGLNGRWVDTTINVARIDGGGPNNMVPDVAVVRFNVRYADTRQEDEIRRTLDELIDHVARASQVTAVRYGDFSAPPKRCDPPTEDLLHHLQDVAGELGLPLSWRETGGVCDGNRLAALGVPNVDTLGPRGGGIHSPQEHVLLDSLPERAKLTALTLMRLADGTLDWPFANRDRGASPHM